MPNAANIPPVISDGQHQPLTPVATSERVETLDVLRGFALFGILTVNLAWFSWPVDLMRMGHQFWETRADLVTDGIIQFLAEGKFYPLFSLLFGWGVAIQMERAETHGVNFVRRFCRRLLVLLAFGLAHALLVWDGDVLVWYALCGFLLLPFRKCQPKTLLIWAAVFLLIPVLLILLLWALLAGVALFPEMAPRIQKALTEYSETSRAQIEETIRVFASGSYAEIFQERLGNLIYLWLTSIFYVPTFFAMFLVGLYAGQRRLLQDLELNSRLIRRVLIWGLIIGLPANLFYAAGTMGSDLSDVRFTWLLSQAVVAIGGPAQSLAYAAALAFLLRNERWKRGLRFLAATGRMALSNYLLQSLICTAIFYSYGLGLFGAMGRATGLGLALVIYLTQVGCSLWWLSYFRFGPMEWLWRTLTYGQRQPMRR